MRFKEVVITAILVMLVTYALKMINRQWRIPILGNVIEEVA